jgi:TIR domain
MPYVPGFDYDLFISYAAADNTKGEVAEFVETLEKQISDNLVNAYSKAKIRVYFDREDLATKTAFDWKKRLEEAASSSAILVPLLSPNYLSSRYCNEERQWFGKQPHASEQHPYAVAGWVPIGQNLQPIELQKAQRHPAGDTWLALLEPDERERSCKEFALKLRTALEDMRKLVPAVFLGPAVEDPAAATRQCLMDELVQSGYRVVPDANFAYENPDAVRASLKSSLIAVHFLGGGPLEGLEAITESFSSGCKTVLVQPNGSTLSDDERELLQSLDAAPLTAGTRAGAAYDRLEGKTDGEIVRIVHEEVLAVRFQKNKSEFAVGIACATGDLGGANALAALISNQGIQARCPPVPPAIGPNKPSRTKEEILEAGRAMRQIITGSRALICYQAEATGEGLGKTVASYSRRKVKAWYLAPPRNGEPGPPDAPDELILRQTADTPDLATLEPFLRKLGWKPPA